MRQLASSKISSGNSKSVVATDASSTQKTKDAVNIPCDFLHKPTSVEGEQRRSMKDKCSEECWDAVCHELFSFEFGHQSNPRLEADAVGG